MLVFTFWNDQIEQKSKIKSLHQTENSSVLSANGAQSWVELYDAPLLTSSVTTENVSITHSCHYPPARRE